MHADAVSKECNENHPIGSICADYGQKKPNFADLKKKCTTRPDLGTEVFPLDTVFTPGDDVKYVVFNTNHAPFFQGKQ